MKDRIKTLVWLAVYWMIFFESARILFFLYEYTSTVKLSAREIFMPLWLGLRMDAAMAAYWLILPGLLLTFSPLLSNGVIKKVLNGITLFLLTVSCVIIIVDLELYQHWGFRMNTTPLGYIGPESMSSVNPTHLLLLVILLVLLFSSFAWTYLKKISPLVTAYGPMHWKASLVLFLITGSLFIPIRSSFDVAPLNTGVVYFHRTKSFPNHAGINVVWNFFRSLSSNDALKYPEDFFPGPQAQANTRLMVQTNGPTRRLVSGRPNIILIVLESFTSKIIAPLGGMPDVTPNLNQLFKESIRFTNLYASGDRTDKGIVTLLSGYPAQPETSIIKYPEKAESLPHLPTVLKKYNYSPSFVYGGDIGFANMESYVTLSGFQHITEEDDFDSRLDNSKWGIHDEYVFDRLLEECDSAKSPFFKMMLSLSSHEPFDVPHISPFTGSSERSLFLNACHYTDSCLGAFIRSAKSKPWWNNTWIIITADHGHRFPDPEELKDKARFAIPMLWLGGALHTQDSTISLIGSQTDVANTLLAQIDRADPQFMFSKDLLSADVKPFAVYVFNNGFGYVSPEGESIYDFDFKNYVKKSGLPHNLKWGESYMQTLFLDYDHR